MTGIQHFLGSLRKEAWGLIGLGVVMAFGTAWLVHGGNVRPAVAGALLSVLAGLVLISPRAAIVATLVFLTVLGELRRVLIPLAGWSSQDPILLVGPAVAVLLVAFIVAGQRLRLDTPLSLWISVLMLLMLLQVVNPTQGSLFVGLGGALFYLVPLLWFWIGRSYATPRFVRLLLYRVVVPLAGMAAVLGLYQGFYGLLPFEQDWVDLGGYAALNIAEEIRPISFFASAAEYAYFLGVALVVLWASWLKRAYIGGLVLVPLLASALFLISSRGILVLVLFTVALLWAVQAHSLLAWSLRLVLGLALGVAVSILGLQLLQSLVLGGRVGALVDHQVLGLLNPFDPQHSTLSVHVSLLLKGFAAGVTNPLGEGLGSTNLAAQKFSDTASTSALVSAGTTGGTEVDVSNMFVSLGVAGGVVYMVIIALVLLTAFSYWRLSHTLVGLAILGVLAVNLGQWLTGGHYAMSALVWFCIGALDKFSRERRGTDENRSRGAQRSQGRWAGTRELRGSARSPSSWPPSDLGGQRNRS